METVSFRSVPIGPSTSLPQPMGLISAPPSSLKSIAVGEKLDAFVLQGMNKGFAEIDTQFGKLQLTTNFPLRTKTNLQLQIIGKHPFMQFLITSVQEENPQSALQNSNINHPTKAPSSTEGNAPSTPLNTIHLENPKTVFLTLGANVVATNIGVPLTPTSPLAPPGITPPPSVSSEIPTHVNQVAQNVLGKNTSSLTQNVDKSYSINNTLNHTASQFSVRITKVLPPYQLSSGGGMPTKENNNLTVGQVITGVVTMTSPQGHAIVQTHSGPISLATPNLLPPGTTISFLIITALNSISIETLSGMANQNADVIMGEHRWPELSDAIRALSTGHPTLGQQVINSILPKTGPGLATNIILLISAIRNGDIRNWLGDAPVRALQRIKPELMSRLRDDFSQISRLSDDNISNVWRSYPLPFFNGQELDQIRLYIKRKSESDDDDSSPNQETRFILDLNLAHIGRLQLDGLVRSSQKCLDLILKSDNPLNQTLQNGIRDVFQKALEQTGHMGGLTFQSAPAVFTNIQSDRTSSRDMGIIV